MITTRDRLLAAGLSLIAERGFKETTVGDIETAAGLVPRSGGLYKHFPSKQALIEAGLEARIERVNSLAQLRNSLTEPTSASERREVLIMIGEAVLEELDREREISRIIERDGDRFPELRASMHDDLVEVSFVFMESVLGRWIESYHGPEPERRRLAALDLPATAAIVLGSLVNLRRHTWMFGTPVHGIDDKRFLASWADMTLLLFTEES